MPQAAMLEFYKALDKMEVELMPEISGEGAAAAAPPPGTAPAVKEEAQGLLATTDATTADAATAVKGEPDAVKTEPAAAPAVAAAAAAAATTAAAAAPPAAAAAPATAAAAAAAHMPASISRAIRSVRDQGHVGPAAAGGAEPGRFGRWRPCLRDHGGELGGEPV